MPKPKCKQCETEISNKLVYIEQDVNKKDGTVDKKKIYFCCVECRNEFEKKQKEKENKPKSERRQLTDVIKSIYDSSGITKIEWGCEATRIEAIKKENPDLKMTDEGIKRCLDYIVKVKLIDVFDNNGGSILNIVPYYYAESNIYEKQKEFINSLIKECVELGYTTKQKDKEHLLASLQKLMRHNKNYKIITIRCIIDYLRDIKEYSLFNEDRITILGAIEYNFDEVKDYYAHKQELEKIANNFDMTRDIRSVKGSFGTKRVKEMEW